MSSWLVSSSGNIPFASAVTPANHSYSYYVDQALTAQQSSPNIAGAILPGHAATLPGQLDSTASKQPGQHPYTQYTHNVYGQAWPGQQSSASQPLIANTQAANPKTDASASGSAALEQSSQKVRSLESELQSVHAQLERQQGDGRALQAQVESLTAELASERQRSDDLGRQLHAAVAAHHALKVEHDRLIAQHAAVVREHEHMVSSRAATLRELEARHADVSRLQRQLEESQAAAVAAAAAAAEEAVAATVVTAATGAARGAASGGGGGSSGGHTGHAHRISPRGGPGGPSGAGLLSTAEEERWVLRLHKAERALEEERRVSEGLRQRLAAAEAEARAAVQRLRQLEGELEGGQGGVDAAIGPTGLTATSSEPLPWLQRTSQTFTAPASSPVAGAGSLTGMSSAPPGALSGGGGVAAGGPSSAAGKPLRPGDQDQLARLKKEVEGLRADLARLAASEEAQRVTARAAEDRARAAEAVSLDVRRQCDQAARTIGRLIDENSELVTKVNTQANVLADCKTSVAAKEAELRALQARLAQAHAQLASHPSQRGEQVPGSDTNPSDQPPSQQSQQDGASPHLSPVKPGSTGTASTGVTGSRSHAQSDDRTSLRVQQQQQQQQQAQDLQGGRALSLSGVSSGGGASAREVLLPDGALTEADWKLVMLAEEVRRLVEEVSLARAACLALELRRQCCGGGGSEGETTRNPHVGVGATFAGSNNSGVGGAVGADGVEARVEAAAPLDLPRILSRLEGLAGRRLVPGETAAYIVELAWHMEALEGVLQAQQQRMEALREEHEQQQQHQQQPAGSAGADDGEGMGVASVAAGAGRGSDAGRGEGQQRIGMRADQQHGVVQGTEADTGLQQQQQAQSQSPFAQLAAAPLSAEAVDASEASAAGFGSFVQRELTPSEPLAAASGQQQQQPTTIPIPALPPPMLPTAPPQTSQQQHHQQQSAQQQQHVVSPFHHLKQRTERTLSYDYTLHPRDSVQGAAGPDTTRDGLSDPQQQQPQPHMQRPDLAAAAAAAIAAAAAAQPSAPAPADAPESETTQVSPHSGREAQTDVLPNPAADAQFQAVPMSPSAMASGVQPGPSADATEVPVQVSTALAGPASVVATRVAGTRLDDDDLLLEAAAAGRGKPRRTRVGLWGWISGETAR